MGEKGDIGGDGIASMLSVVNLSFRNNGGLPGSGSSLGEWVVDGVDGAWASSSNNSLSP